MTETSAAPPSMPLTLTPQDKENAQLRRQLAEAERRLELAQSFVYDLRCSAARKEGRGFWVRRDDRSGMRAALWEEGKEDLGDWEMMKKQDVPVPDPALSQLTPAKHDLYAELGAASPLPSDTQFTKRFPPELLYHVLDHSTRSTKHFLCLASSSFRAVASPRLYETLKITSPAQLVPFLSNPLTPLAPFNRSLTLDSVVTLDITVLHGHQETKEAIRLGTYIPLPLPPLRHLIVRPKNAKDAAEHNPSPTSSPATRGPSIPPLSLAASFLSHLDPRSLSIWAERPSNGWITHNVPQSIWAQAVSTWTRLDTVSFVDCFGMHLSRGYEGGDGTREPLSQSDFPRCAPSLFWTFSEWCARYELESHQRRNRGDRSPLHLIAKMTSKWSLDTEWFIHFILGEGGDDKEALRRDMKVLPEKWRGLVLINNKAKPMLL